MYLTRAEIAHGAGATAAWASMLKDGARFDCGHKLVWTLFAARSEDFRRDFLWREVEPGSYIVLSAQEPRDETRLWRIASKRFEPELAAGDRLSFSLRANPAIAVCVPGQRGKRADAVMHAKRPAKEREAQGAMPLDAEGREKAALDWLFKREERLGVAFEREHCRAMGYDTIRAGGASNGGEIKFASVDYEGVLDVRNPARFIAALAAGIGKAKAFGCGLMLIRRA